MEIHTRIRELRKNFLHLSQEAFGQELGVSRSVIKNIELNVLARPEQKLSLYKLICSRYNVNENWLLNGEEPMFIEQSTSTLDAFFKKHNASKVEIEIIKAYFEIDPIVRNSLIEHFKTKLLTQSTSSIFSSIPDISEEETHDNSMTVEEFKEIYNSIPDTVEELEKLYPPIDIKNIKKAK